MYIYIQIPNYLGKKMFDLTTDYFLLKQLKVVIQSILLPLLSFIVYKENYKLCFIPNNRPT